MDQENRQNADDSRLPLRGADGRFISQRVIVTDDSEKGPPTGSTVSPSVVPMYPSDDGFLPTRTRFDPTPAPKTGSGRSTRLPRQTTPLTDEEMWNSDLNDGGKSALAVTRGQSTLEAIPDPVMFAAMLLNPEKFAPDLTEWKKEVNRTMPRLAQAYSANRPEIADGVAFLSTLQ